jgi:hypothetical protein
MTLLCKCDALQGKRRKERSEKGMAAFLSIRCRNNTNTAGAAMGVENAQEAVKAEAR